jgi:hypothetical protein
MRSGRAVSPSPHGRRHAGAQPSGHAGAQQGGGSCSGAIRWSGGTLQCRRDHAVVFPSDHLGTSAWKGGPCRNASRWPCRGVDMEGGGTMQKCFQVVMQGRQHGRGGAMKEGFLMVMQERQQGRGDHAGMLPGGQIKV